MRILYSHARYCSHNLSRKNNHLHSFILVKRGIETCIAGLKRGIINVFHILEIDRKLNRLKIVLVC